MKRAALAVGLLVLGAACSSPAQPAAIVPPPIAAPQASALAGTWTGSYHIASCTIIAGGQCRSVGYMYSFRLTIDQAGDVLTGSFEGATPQSFTATLRGVAQSDQPVVFDLLSSNSANVTVSELRVAPAGLSGVSGRVTYTYRDSRDAFTVIADIRSASRNGPPPPFSGSPADFVGSWSGEATYDGCIASGTANCSLIIPRKHTYRLTLATDGTGLSGLFQSGLSCWPLVRLSGVPQSDGTVIFTGVGQGGAWASCIDRAEVLRLQLSVDPNAGLVGSLDAFARYASAGSLTQHMTFTGGARETTALSPGTLHGSWRGYYVIRECSGDCSRGGQIGRANSFAMGLSQTGSELVGSLNEVVVTGSASGSSASIAGERIAASCPWDWEGIRCTERIRGLSVTVDQFGQMRGSFEYYQQANHSGLYEMTLRVDLIEVVKIR